MKEKKLRHIDNQLRLDTTGLYFSFKTSQRSISFYEIEENTLERLFLDNAFILLDNYDLIMSDSRMFFCPIPSSSGLAYTGRNGFLHPTLGVFLEWWKSCPTASVIDNNGEKWLVYHISGSPLSGNNNCVLVNRQGLTKTQRLGDFHNVWRSFVEINTQYDDMKEKHEAYTLPHTLEQLAVEADGMLAVEIERTVDFIHDGVLQDSISIFL